MSTKDDSGPGGAERSQSSSRKDHKSPPKQNEPPSAKRDWKCPDCTYAGSSMDKLKRHYQNAHAKQLVDLKAQNTEEKQKKPDATEGSGVPGKVPDHIRRSIFVLSDYVRRKDREPLIGLEYILEYKVHVQPDITKLKYFCEVCEMDSAVVPMVDHLCGFRHRKLYVAKEYPYVLPALFKTKEDKAVFMRRMATEIEREEGTKTYKTDPIVRTVALMNVKSTEAKQSKRRTRWNSEGERQKKMNEALDRLESLTLANEEEASAAEKLSEKLEADIKSYTDHLKEEALFSAKVSRAKDAALSIMRNAVRERVSRLPSLMKIPFDKVIGQPENIDPKHNMGMPSGPSLPNSDKPYWGPNAAFPQRLQNPPFLPSNQKHNYQTPAENTWRDQLANLEVQIDENDEDILFLKKLMALLDLIPQSPAPTDDPEMDSKLLMIKSFLLDDTANIGNTAAADQLLMQLTALTQGMTTMEDLSLNPQSAMMAPKNTAAAGEFGQGLLTQMASVPKNMTHMASVPRNMTHMASVPRNMTQMASAPKNMMQMASVPQNMMQMASVPTNTTPVDSAQENQDALLQIAALLQNSQVNATPFLPEKQNVPNQEFRQMDDRSMMPKAQTAYRHQYMKQQPGYASTSQGREDFGYDRHMARGYGIANRSQYEGNVKSRGYRPNEPTRDLYAERKYDSGMYGRERGESSYSNISNRGASQKYDDYTVEQPYARVCLPPTNQRSERFQDIGHDQDLRRESRSHEIRSSYGAHSSRTFEDPPWAERESDPYYGKRTKLDSGPMASRDTDQRKHYPDEGDSRGINPANLSVDLLKKIRGKDLFTVSAILSEYADSHSS